MTPRNAIATGTPRESFHGDMYARFVRKVVVPLWALKEGSRYPKHLKSLVRGKYRPIDDVRQDQWRRLKEILDHAFADVEFYRERFERAALVPEDIRSWEDVPRIPVLTKDDIRANRDRMVSRTVSKDKLIRKKTSGSTGVSLEFYIDDDSNQWKRACALSYDRWTGWEIGEKVGSIWGNPGYKKNWRGHVRNFLLERHTYLDTLKMDQDAMFRFYREIRRKEPTLLFGHAHSIFLFARFLKSRGLSGIHPKGIISTAMVLHDFERDLIEEVFGCRVTNRYGCEEVSLIACECPEHRGFHTNCDTLVVEVIKDGRPAKIGEAGAIVVTDLTNHGMPFIRYKVGDAAVPSDRRCPCGCAYPLLESLEGRIADYVMTPEGEYISGISLTENFAMHLHGVKQLQIVQEEIDRLLFRVVRGEDYRDAFLEEIGALVRKRFGAKMRHEVEFIDSIPPERSGKYRFCISKLKDLPF